MVFTAFSPVAPPWADVIRQGCRKPGTLTPINWSREGWFPPHAPFVAETTYFLRESRISRSSITSSGVAAGPSSGLGISLFTALTRRKMMKNRIRKRMEEGRVGKEGGRRRINREGPE